MGTFKIRNSDFRKNPKKAVKSALEDDLNKEFLTYLDNNSSDSGEMFLSLICNGFRMRLAAVVVEVYFQHFKENNPLKKIATGDVLDTGKKDVNGRPIVQLHYQFLN